MSRTYKDRPYKVRFPESHGRDDNNYYDRYEYVSYYVDYKTKKEVEYVRAIYLPKKGAKTKKPKHVDTEYHWMSTPSWWTHMFMIRPMRSKGRQWEKNVKYETELEDADPPGVSRKPHAYYW